MSLHLKLSLLFIVLFIYASCTTNNSNNISNIEALPINNTLHLKESIAFDKEFALINPLRILNLNDEFIIVSELKSVDFFNVISLPDLKYLYSWGYIGAGPNPEEFQNVPVYLNSDNRNLIVYEGLTRQLKHVEISDTSVSTIRTQILSYDSQLDPLNRVRRINDSLYFADYGLSQEETENEQIALRPDYNEPLFTFGNYPDTELTGVDRYSYYNRENLSKPDGSKFASFYFKINQFKIYNNKGNLLHEIHIKDNFVNKEIYTDLNRYLYRVPAWASNNYLYTLGLNAPSNLIYDNSDEDNPIITLLEVWDWEGNPLYRASFDRQISNFTVSEEFGEIYAYSSYSEGNLFIYDLTKILNEINDND